MDLNEYQNLAQRTSGSGHDRVKNGCMGLIGESGEIVDIMKTLDNRYIMTTHLLKQNGIEVDTPDYVSVDGEEVDEYVPGRDF